MPVCKKCNSQNTTKNGFVRNKQRYKCKDCEFNFTEGDSRTNQSIIVKRALAVILYSLGKASFGFIGKLFGVHKTTILKWIRSEGRNLKDPQFKPEITEVEIDEMWHFLKKKEKSYGYSKQWIEMQKELLLGLQEIAQAKQSKDFMKN